MNMPRSQSESENIQFVQELAEVDGPFESPININFRDLTKLELPSLVWNRGDTCPKKMKITNTGHTVIISGKWKCERPYLTGGPLSGKYVFSQIHFHWGQDDCSGSEHQVCGDGFPLEMHVAHFKTEYLTQECALREKDGMVVVVYLFKLQDEPNQSLKKIINLLPCVQQPSTSHAVDPRPILSFCNPFTDDYFMYWGSVVTSTCAHILLWIICREPFGISRDQVNEFRKIMDSTQQPIFRNSRDIQPLHKRNVFHVNASKHLDNPLLPVKNILGCFCKESGENVAVQKQKECRCYPALQNQEDVEGGAVEYPSGNPYLYTGGVDPLRLKVSLPGNCFHHNRTVFVQRATIHSVSVVLKRFGSEPVGNAGCHENSKQDDLEDKGQSKLVSKSCCFFLLNERNDIRKTDNRKTRGKRPFNSFRAFSQIMHSLEVLKNQTFKKLKEIESINQEIKGMKPFCQDNEDRQWLRKIEKIMKRQKRLTIRSSQGCLRELKKLARDCNLDKIFDCKPITVNENNGKLVWLYHNNEITKENICSPSPCAKQQELPGKESSKQFVIGKASKFSAKAQKLIQSFFEDIQDSDEVQETVKKDLNLKKMKSFYSKEAGDSNSVSSVIKGYITPKMFLSGNLGHRFFTEVTTEDSESDEIQWQNANETDKSLTPKVVIKAEEVRDNSKFEKTSEPEVQVLETQRTTDDSKFNKEALTLTSKESKVTIVLSKTCADDTQPLYDDLADYSNEEKPTSKSELPSDLESIRRDKKTQKPRKKLEKPLLMKMLCDKDKKPYESTSNKSCTTEGNDLIWKSHANRELKFYRSSSNLSTETTDTQSMIIAKFRRRRCRMPCWEQNSSDLGVRSYTSLCGRNSCNKFEGFYIHKKNQKIKKRKKQKNENLKHSGSSSREASRVTVDKWKSLTKARFKLEVKREEDSLIDLALQNPEISPRRKKMKLQSSKTLLGEKNKIFLEDRVDSANEEVVKHRLKEKDHMTVNSTERSFLSLRNPNKNSPTDRKEWTYPSKTSLSKSARASSADSKVSTRERKKTVGEFRLATEFFGNTDAKLKFKSRSLTSMPTQPMLSAEIALRLYLESIEDRRKNNEEVTDIRKQLECPKKLGESFQIKRGLSDRKFTENESDGEQEQHHQRQQKQQLQHQQQQPQPEQQRETNEIYEKPASNKVAYEVGFFTTAASQVDEELLPKTQAQEVKVLKRCDVGKYRFLEKELHELNESFQERKEEHPEILHQTDSNKSFTKDAYKGDADPQNNGNKDLQTSLSYLRPTMNSPSRRHSAETLNSLTKTLNRKGKKRPHCCKRVSRHYIRKNSSIFKKPNKTESKQLNFLNLTDQEQLKIISVNVAKYLKQKLIEENKGLDPGKTSIENIEEAVLTKLKSAQDKEEEKPQKEADTNKVQKTRQNKIPTLKARERKREKVTHSESKTKTIKSPREPRNDKPACAVPVLPKPVNNFIKLNKQMAGKYKKKLPPPPEEKTEPKEKQKQKPTPETPKKSEIPKLKTRIPKKRVEKNIEEKSQQQQQQPKTGPETPLTPTKQKLSQARKASNEKCVKSPRKKPGSKKPSTAVAPSNGAEDSKELVPLNENPAKPSPTSVTIQEAPAQACPLSYLPAPIEVTENKKLNQCLLGLNNTNLDYLPGALYSNKGKNVMDPNALFKKELECFVKLEMRDFSTIENSLNYAKSMIGQDFGSNFIEKFSVDDPVLPVDPHNKEIVLLKMKDMECSSSCSDFLDDPDKVILGRDITDNKTEDFNRNRGMVNKKVPQESGDPGIMNPSIPREHSKETNSDSSYDCKISITFNTNFNMEGEHPQKVIEESLQNCEEVEGEALTHDVSQEEISSSQLLSCLKEGSSQSLIVKHHRRKRMENEISLEMKHKLLEILEGEIRREVGIKEGGSSGNSSDGLTFKWEEEDPTNRSQSTTSSCDNIEVLNQISDTMRQYLKNLKEKGQLVEILNESLDKESK